MRHARCEWAHRPDAANAGRKEHSVMKIKTSVKAGAGDERPPPNGLNHGLKVRASVKR
ncbi:Hypothetical protein A7982_11778 [Minicystis rosea]|nr:Hypothetical protein A7982_11778 [Minicystis rosea]